jgi:hypothetical protein
MARSKVFYHLILATILSNCNSEMGKKEVKSDSIGIQSKGQDSMQLRIRDLKGNQEIVLHETTDFLYSENESELKIHLLDSGIAPVITKYSNPSVTIIRNRGTVKAAAVPITQSSLPKGFQYFYPVDDTGRVMLSANHTMTFLKRKGIVGQK